MKRAKFLDFRFWIAGFVAALALGGSYLAPQPSPPAPDGVHSVSRLAPRGILNLYVVRGGKTIAHYGPYHNVVTTVGKGFIVDAWQNIVELENMKFHGVGTGTNAAAAGDTALQTELTTQYNPDSTRATGSLTEGASANIFRTVGTNTVDASVAITEWGLFTQAATGGGTMFSRVVFSAINLSSGDSLQTTYDLTVN